MSFFTVVNGYRPFFTTATKIETKRLLWLDIKVLPEGSPSRFKLRLQTGQLEIIHIDDKQQFGHRVMVHGWPLRAHGHESGFPDRLVTMALPHGTTIRVTIQGPDQPDNRLVVLALPFFGSGLIRQTDPASVTS